jgi:ribosomal protein S18 acetylase RimI-like enzyme
MEIHYIKNTNINLLKNFLNNKLSNSFRYYNKRNISIIENHLITIIGLDINLLSIAYGHIDYCSNENIYWLGICILEEYKGKGYGNDIMNKLIEKFKEKNISNKLYLTVDKDNQKAINLYKKFNFNIIEEKETYYKMLLIIQSLT